MTAHYEDNLLYQVALCSADVYLSIKALSHHPVGNELPCHTHIGNNTITLPVTDGITLY